MGFWHDPETGWSFYCGNRGDIGSDEEYERRWNNLPGDAVVQLERFLDNYYDRNTKTIPAG